MKELLSYCERMMVLHRTDKQMNILLSTIRQSATESILFKKRNI